MGEPNVTGMSPAQLQDMLIAVLRESKKLNPVEQRELDNQLAADKRRNQMQAQLGRIEAEAIKRKKDQCSHQAYPAGHKLAGHSCRRGEGNWVTGGQAYQDGTAMLICLRCSSTFHFRPTPEYFNQILQNGLLGEAPPPPEQCLCSSCRELPCRCEEIQKERDSQFAMA